MTTGYIFLPVEGGGSGTGNINSINGSTAANQLIVGGTNIAVVNGGATHTINLNGPVPISLGGTGQSNQQAALNNLTDIGSHSNGDVLQLLGGNAQFAPFSGGTPTGTANTFAYFNPSGNLDSIPGWTTSASPIDTASNVNLLFQPNNLAANPSGFGWNINIEPLQDSPNDSLTIHNIFSNLDNTANGFNVGSAGNSVTLLNLGYTYNGNGSVYGRTTYINLNAGVGNGTDPVTVNGHTFCSASWNVFANATVDGSINGYSFQPTLDAAAITTANTSVTAFLDIATLPVSIKSYQSANYTPQIGTIANNSGYTGLNISPTISNFAGNANAVGFSINGSFANFGSGGFTGVIVNPNLNTIVNNNTMLQLGGQSASGTGSWTALQISDGAINTSGTVKGMQINVDPVNQAIDSQGHHALQSQNDLVSSAGQINGNIIGGSLIVPDATAITGTDAFGNNFAFTIDLGDATSSYVSASGLVGLTNVGFVGQITGDGTADLINFCLAGFQNASTGTIQRVNNLFAASIPAGGGTIVENVLLLASQPFGAVGTSNWGVRVEDAHLESYAPKFALNTADKKVYSDSLLSLGDQAILSGDNHANIRNIRSKTDPDGYAVDSGYSAINVSTFTDDSSVANCGIHTTSKVIVASTKTIGGMVGVFNQISRVEAGDDGTVPIVLGYHVGLASGNSATKSTPLYASYFTGFHSIDSNANQITNMYDFYAQASSIGSGAVTTRYGIVVEQDSGYIKKNWLSGQLVVAGSSPAPTNDSVGIEVAGTTSALLVSRLTTTEKNALTAVNGMIVYDTDLDKFQGYEAGAWTNLI